MTKFSSFALSLMASLSFALFTHPASARAKNKKKAPTGLFMVCSEETSSYPMRKIFFSYNGQESFMGSVDATIYLYHTEDSRSLQGSQTSNIIANPETGSALLGLFSYGRMKVEPSSTQVSSTGQEFMVSSSHLIDGTVNNFRCVYLKDFSSIEGMSLN